jgi:hypothetical protein
LNLNIAAWCFLFLGFKHLRCFHFRSACGPFSAIQKKKLNIRLFYSRAGEVGKKVLKSINSPELGLGKAFLAGGRKMALKSRRPVSSLYETLKNSLPPIY